MRALPGAAVGLLITAVCAMPVSAQDPETEYVVESRLLESEIERYGEARQREQAAIQELRRVAALLDDTLGDPNAPVAEMRELEARFSAALESAYLRAKETGEARRRMYERMDRMADLALAMEAREPVPVADEAQGPDGLWKFRFRGTDLHALVDMSFEPGGLDRSWVAVGTYRTNNGHRGTLRGVFKGNWLELEAMDSRRGKVASLEGTVGADGRLQGTWHAVESGLGPDRPAGGAWSAQRVAAESTVELD